METPANPRKLAGRYEIRDILGRGGMGLVYRAYDTVIRREVAVKTIIDIPDPASLQLFYKECDVLASMSHPNIVEIFDIGEFEEDGKNKPYFVMPLLPGSTLEAFIRKASHRLTVERTIEIISQACRGLQAAHERGLIHRDLKPSNIFVMEDDSVKIIDFGIAHMTDTHTTRGQKGTLLYMSPEQIEMKPLSPLSDVFSLSVVCYEALTGRQPFARARADEIVDAIRRQIPPPASDINSGVNQSIGRVVHKGMAKQAWHRFSSVRDFGDTLHKALRNEPIEFFDASRTRPRVERATKALESGDYQFAGEILGELEAEGHIDASIISLRHQLDSTVRRKTVTQLLEAAKARFEEEEDPLALQKLQEVLQMEPDNTSALSLKGKIENRRSERQIENWYRLARQHLENHAYPHAREALQNVVDLRPKEARALQLIAEVDREEQEYNKLRQEKTKIHRAAMDAWQKGDVSSALNKLAVVLELDRRAPDVTSPERGASYQSFYDDVRSEHDAMNTAYAEARSHLAERNFTKALTVSEAYLTKYPNNAIFQALKYDIEEQQRQQLSSFVASVDRQVEAEPDLDKRVNILQEALDLHPGETHFERALRSAKDKRDLVNSIVDRAHVHEEQTLFSDALNDWEILRTIYGQYPGLKFEIERLQKRRDQQSRIEAKTRLVEQVDACLHSSDYGRALDLLQQASREFPNDAELGELEKLANDGVQRATEAHRLMTEGQELCVQDRFADGITLLRQAYELDEHNALTRAVFSNALVEQARLIAESNWQEADQLAQQALDLNPGHPLGKTIRTLILDQKREQVVGECLSQARKLQAGGDLAGALARVESEQAAYPREPRLIQIHETLRREHQSHLRQTRRRDLEELQRMEREVETITDPGVKKVFGDRVQLLAAKYAGDDELLGVANGLLQRLDLATVAAADLQQAPPGMHARPSIDETVATMTLDAATMEAHPQNPPELVPAAPPPPEVSVLPPPPPVVKAQPVVSSARPQVAAPLSAAPSGILQTPLAKWAAAGALLILLLAFSWLLRRHRNPTSPASAVASISVHVHTSPPGATIRINNQVRGVSNLQVDLPEGSYQIQADLDGYQPQVSSITAKTGSPNSVELMLQPALPVAKLSSDTGIGKVAFDRQPAVDLAGTQWTLDQLAAGDHSLKFDGPQGAASFNFSVDAGSLPVVKGPITANGVLAVVVSSTAGRAHVYSSDSAVKLTLDGQPEPRMSKDGWDFPQLSPGSHELALSHGADQYKLALELGAQPILSAFLESGQNIGTLLVETGEDKVKVFLNGQLQKGVTQGGQLRISNLAPKDYQVRVTKAGFQNIPDQQVHIRKGEQSKVSFSLQVSPHFATLSVQGGTPGAQLLIDQTAVGSIQADGTFSYASVNPGDHVIELRKDRFSPKRLTKHFMVGANVALEAADSALVATAGELRIAFTPPDAAVSLAKAGESPSKITSGNSVSLAPGSYTLTAKVADGFSRSAQLEVIGGQSRNLDLALAPDGMSKWDDPASWKPEKNGFTHKGGDFVLYNVSPTTGTFTFSATLQKGHWLQWVMNYLDTNNYVLFQMDENNFYRSVLRNGQKSDEIKIPHKTEKKSFRYIQLRVTSNEIVSHTKEGDAWVVLDKWTAPRSNLGAGKFGFLIPGNDQVTLASFTHYADLVTQR